MSRPELPPKCTECGPLRLCHQTVHGTKLLVGVSCPDRPGEVATVPLNLRSHVDDDWFAILDSSVAWRMVWSGCVRTGSDDRVEGGTCAACLRRLSSMIQPVPARSSPVAGQLRHGTPGLSCECPARIRPMFAVGLYPTLTVQRIA